MYQSIIVYSLFFLFLLNKVFNYRVSNNCMNNLFENLIKNLNNVFVHISNRDSNSIFRINFYLRLMTEGKKDILLIIDFFCFSVRYSTQIFYLSFFLFRLLKLHAFKNISLSIQNRLTLKYLENNLSIHKEFYLLTQLGTT